MPHISLVFREIWDTTALHRQLSSLLAKLHQGSRPPTSREKRGDMGHPSSAERVRRLGDSLFRLLSLDDSIICLRNYYDYGKAMVGLRHTFRPTYAGATRISCTALLRFHGAPGELAHPHQVDVASCHPVEIRVPLRLRPLLRIPCRTQKQRRYAGVLRSLP